jgi:hypothetical protein
MEDLRRCAQDHKPGRVQRVAHVGVDVPRLLCSDRRFLFRVLYHLLEVSLCAYVCMQH